MGFRKRKQQPHAFHAEAARQRTEKDQAKLALAEKMGSAPAKAPAKAPKKKTATKRGRK